jgi:hypothetical protein
MRINHGPTLSDGAAPNALRSSVIINDDTLISKQAFVMLAIPIGLMNMFANATIKTLFDT